MSSLRVANEFAVVDMQLRELASGVVLEISDPRSGARIWLDALELEALTRLSLDNRRNLVDPSVKYTTEGQQHDAGHPTHDDYDSEFQVVGW